MMHSDIITETQLLGVVLPGLRSRLAATLAAAVQCTLFVALGACGPEAQRALGRATVAALRNLLECPVQGLPHPVCHPCVLWAVHYMEQLLKLEVSSAGHVLPCRLTQSALVLGATCVGALAARGWHTHAVHLVCRGDKLLRCERSYCMPVLPSRHLMPMGNPLLGTLKSLSSYCLYALLLVQNEPCFLDMVDEGFCEALFRCATELAAAPVPVAGPLFSSDQEAQSHHEALRGVLGSDVALLLSWLRIPEGQPGRPAASDIEAAMRRAVQVGAGWLLAQGRFLPTGASVHGNLTILFLYEFDPMMPHCSYKAMC